MGTRGTMRGRVSVCVPVKDRRERMLRALDALLAQDHPDFEVLVLDNGSTDGTPEACRERARDAGVPVRVETVEGKVGRVRNVGARLASGEFVAYTDSDCMAEPSWLSAAVRAFEDPQVGVVTGCTLPEPGVPRGEWHATLEVTGQTWRFESANVLFRHRAFCATAGFDEELGHFWEDTGAGLAMLRAGWRARYVPDAVVHHDVTHPGFAWHLRRAHKYGKAAAVVRRYPEARRLLLWRRWFLRSRDARFVAALAGVALAPVTRKALVLGLPYAWLRRPVRPTPKALRAQVQYTVFDFAVLAGMLRGSARWRRLVL